MSASVRRHLASYFVGLDPGGKRAFGWCVMRATRNLMVVGASGTCSGAQIAVAAVAGYLSKKPPIAIGIDAPLFWSLSGDRQADTNIRNAVCRAGGNPGTVNHVNSMRGACLVEGILAVSLLEGKWPGIAITEAHPKALLRIHKASRVLVSRCKA